MSFIITVYTNEGIVMASDSRITYNNTQTLPDGTIQKNIGVQITDTRFSGKPFLIAPLAMAEHSLPSRKR